MPAAVIYARFSPRPDSGEESIKTQLESCREWCRAHALQIREEFIDENRSGSDAGRPGLWGAVARVERGDVLVVWKLDRLARSVYLSAHLENELSKLGARVVSTANEGTWDDTPEQRFMRQILRAYAEFEREIIRFRTRAGLQRRAREGRRISRHPPYGWCLRPSDPRHLDLHPAERRICEQILILVSKRFSPEQIMKILNDNGVKYRGSRWNVRKVQHVIEQCSTHAGKIHTPAPEHLRPDLAATSESLQEPPEHVSHPKRVPSRSTWYNRPTTHQNANLSPSSTDPSPDSTALQPPPPDHPPNSTPAHPPAPEPPPGPPPQP